MNDTVIRTKFIVNLNHYLDLIPHNILSVLKEMFLIIRLEF